MKKVVILSCMLFVGFAFPQNQTQTLEELFEEIAKEQAGLDELTELDVAGLTLFEIITSLAEEHRINVSADPGLSEMVVSNFFDVKVKDIYIFLANKYNLEVGYMNNIITFKKREVLKEVPKEQPKKPIDITFNQANDFLSVKLKNDSLPLVAERITELSNKNIVLAPEVKTMKVSAYIINRPFDQVIEMIARSNQLVASVDENGFYFLSKDLEVAQVPDQGRRTAGRRRGSTRNTQSTGTAGDLEIALNEQGFLTIRAYEIDAATLISKASDLLNINYFFYDKPDEAISTFYSESIDFDNLLNHLFKGTRYTSKKLDDLYLIGLQTTEGLRQTELIQLENRTIETVLNTLPKAYVQDVEMQEFVELNGILVSGSKPILEELKLVIQQLDKVVPLVQIEVLIVQYQKGYDIQTGLQGILSEQGKDVKTEGVLFPTVDATVNSTSLNKLIDAFNGLGIINIGKVAENFYANLTALENNSIIELKSTPKIATLSGHKANVSIGETNYYFEQTNRLINSGINDNILQSGQWKPTEANLSVDILPYVSKDEHITLNIIVEKSAFLGRAGENAPPGKSTQKFESLIRVKNNEMILLGGLDELEKENSGTGTPFLARIPVIKWFFSSKRRSKEKSKLHVFIKPTVVY
ncbi:type II and III secretion system protein [Flavobacteriaceae bacterium TP-CH-4]|uniref:Type II and III secretion system protein n=1 Tax=Pelagihabitans pacificus TaxID=2696054 RepID=A0A967E5W1_9FLAO|nr:type II and III secretion system protein [Pelagihabitans pacificus]NHF58995.1 type II and III secretion system protein [Pelagihabitans pacificus]